MKKLSVRKLMALVLAMALMLSQLIVLAEEAPIAEAVEAAEAVAAPAPEAEPEPETIPEAEVAPEAETTEDEILLAAPVEGDAAECEAELTGEDAPEGEADLDEAGALCFAAEAAFEGGTFSTKEEFDNWYAAAKERAEGADHLLGPDGDINTKFYSVILPDETIAVVPTNAGVSDIDIKTGIVGFGFTIYQLDNPVVVTEYGNRNLLPRTGVPKKTSLTVMATEEFKIPYGANGYVQSTEEGSISTVTYVSLYRNDTGHPIMMRKDSLGEPQGAGKMVGIGSSSGTGNGFQGHGTIYRKPKFTFLEPYYELTLAPGFSLNDYVWPNGRPDFPIKIIIDNQTRTYKLPNPIKKGNLFFMWDDDRQWQWGNNPNTSAPEQKKEKIDYLATIAGGVTTIQINTVKAIEDSGESQCHDVALTPSLDTSPRSSVYPDTLTIGFDPQGGTINGKDYYFCEGYTAEKGNTTFCVDVGTFVPVNGGKTFKGWCTDPNDPEGTLIKDTAPEKSASWRKNGHMDVYAVWATSSSTPADNPVSSDDSKPSTPAADPAPAAPAAPAVAVIPEVSKNSKAAVSAAPGSVYQIDLGGASGTGFKSSNKKVATVDANGVITVKNAGKTKITVKVGKKKRTLTLTIKDPTIPTSVSLTASGPLSGQKGSTVQLTANLPEGTNSGIKWKSSNKKVASVNQNGVVTFKKPGKATITATCTRGKKKSKVKVTVSK